MKRSILVFAMLFGVVAMISFGAIFYSNALKVFNVNIVDVISSIYIPLVIVHFATAFISIFLLSICAMQRSIDKICYFIIVLSLLFESAYLGYMLFLK